jgi:hypothetical protein
LQPSAAASVKDGLAQKEGGIARSHIKDSFNGKGVGRTDDLGKSSETSREWSRYTTTCCVTGSVSKKRVDQADGRFEMADKKESNTVWEAWKAWTRQCDFKAPGRNFVCHFPYRRGAGRVIRIERQRQSDMRRTRRESSMIGK